MTQRTTLLTGIFMAGLAVAIGAFGAHGLKTILEANHRTDTFELAVRYQFYHAFALLITGLLMLHFPSAKFKTAAWLFVIGTILFSGSLYVLSLTGITVLGAVTPFGGVGFIGGWIFMFLAIGNQSSIGK